MQMFSVECLVDRSLFIIVGSSTGRTKASTVCELLVNLNLCCSCKSMDAEYETESQWKVELLF